jgi:NAD(P)H dehydrogenase (quinone)
MSQIDAARPAPRRTALVVHAHPEPASFSTAQMRVAVRALESTGHRVEVLDLYELGFKAVLDRQDFPDADAYFKPQAEQIKAFAAGSLPADVAEHLHALQRAELLVLSFPMWWFSLPAILKGWVDRVFVMGALFGGPRGLFDQAAMSGRRAVLLVSTGGSAESFRNVDGGFGATNDLLLHVHHGMLRFVGYDVLEPVVTYGPAHLDASRRDHALEHVRDAFAQLDDRPSVAPIGATGTVVDVGRRAAGVAP